MENFFSHTCNLPTLNCEVTNDYSLKSPNSQASTPTSQPSPHGQSRNEIVDPSTYNRRRRLVKKQWCTAAYDLNPDTGLPKLV